MLPWRRAHSEFLSMDLQPQFSSFRHKVELCFCDFLAGRPTSLPRPFTVRSQNLRRQIRLYSEAFVQSRVAHTFTSSLTSHFCWANRSVKPKNSSGLKNLRGARRQAGWGE
jgi:hypothetical protein